MKTRKIHFATPADPEPLKPPFDARIESETGGFIALMSVPKLPDPGERLTLGGNAYIITARVDKIERFSTRCILTVRPIHSF